MRDDAARGSRAQSIIGGRRITAAIATLGLALFALLGLAAPASAVGVAAELGEDVEVTREEETGKVGFIATDAGDPIARPQGISASDSPQAAARAILAEVGRSFGLSNAGRSLQVRRVVPTPAGGTSVRFQQLHRGAPVIGGELIVNVDADNNILSVNGEASPTPDLDVRPVITPADARELAIASIVKTGKWEASELSVTKPGLSVYDNRLLGGPGLDRPTLVWQTEITAGEADPLRQFVLVDALRGGIALSFDQVMNALNRKICDAVNSQARVPCVAPYARVEGQGPIPGNVDVNDAYDLSKVTYDFFKTRFGRDSVDNAGLPLISTVRYCQGGCPYENAFWNGQQMVYGPNYASADDVVGHELAHGFTDYSSSLFYYYQSGAINESMSDVFGEYLDQTSTFSGPDFESERWLMGEDLPINAIRDMRNPGAFGDPDRMQSPNYHNVDDEDGAYNDSGGVHGNSGVNNKAAFLMVDGGSFNGQSITPLGPTRAAAITDAARLYYTVNNTMLVSASDYKNLATALRQACANLTGTGGITAADCTNVNRVLLATEMDQTPQAAPATDAPTCNTSQVTQNFFFDNLENTASGRWSSGQVIAYPGGNQWYYPVSSNPFGLEEYATSGKQNLWGNDPGSDTGDARSDSAIAMTASTTLPTLTNPPIYLSFNHAFGFEDGFNFDVFDYVGYDGGVLEYSTNGGASWTQVPGIWIGVNGYNGTIYDGSGNPLGGRPGWITDSTGYIGTRVNLNALAGKAVRFRFRLGSDELAGDYGWFIDDIRVYRCLNDTTAPTAKAPTQKFTPAATLGANPAAASIPETISWLPGTDNSGAGLTYQLRESVNGGAFAAITGFTTAKTLNRLLVPGRTYRYQVVAKDPAGNISAPATGPVFKPLVRQDNSAAISYTPGWATASTTTAFGGTVKTTGAANARATTTFTSATNVEVVAPLSSALGVAQVCLFQGSTAVACVNVDQSPPSGLSARKVIFTRDGLNPAATYSVRMTRVSGTVQLDAIVIND